MAFVEERRSHLGKRLAKHRHSRTRQRVGRARELDAAGIAVEDIALRRPTLDEVFLHLTGHDTGVAIERPQEVTA